MTKTTESLEAFYKHKFNDFSIGIKKDIGHFNVFNLEDRIKANAVTPAYIRRDFFKIMLFQGNNTFHYGDESIPVSGNTLLLFNPNLPYTYDPVSADTRGYFCVFKEEFLRENPRINVNELPLFAPGVHPVYQLDEAMHQEVKSIFEKIIREVSSDFIYKYQLIKNYVSELIYMAMKLQPSAQTFQQFDASARIASVFAELLERQFPIESTLQRFELRSPKTIADRLSIHVNYLNRAIKKATGRTTSEHIFERLTGEAKALLKYTDWNISEISYVLGFEDQSHFHNFFKKQTKLSPSSFRQV